MNKEELQYLNIGNYIFAHSQLHEILSISLIKELPEIIVARPLHREDYDYSHFESEHLEQVELTDEWIERMGLLKQVTNGFSIQKTEYHGRWGLYLHNGSGTVFTGKLFGFVHEVQNCLSSLWNKKIKLI